MKQVLLKVVELEDGILLNYKNELKTVFKTPADPRVGAEIEEMRKSIRILDALDKVQGNVLELEDADYAYLQDRMRKAKFGMVHPAVVDFIDEMTTEKGLIQEG